MAGSRSSHVHGRCSDWEGGPGGRPPDAREELCPSVTGPAAHALHEMVQFSRVLFEAPSEGEILRLAMRHIGAAGPYCAEAGYLQVDGDLVPSPRNDHTHAVSVDRRVRELEGRDGPVTLPERPWGWALGLRGVERLHGYLVVSSRARPTVAQRSLLAMLVRHTAAALSVAFAQRRQREDALELYRVREQRATLQQQLISVVAELGSQQAVHALMAEIAARAAVRRPSPARCMSSPDFQPWSKTASDG